MKSLENKNFWGVFFLCDCSWEGEEKDEESQQMVERGRVGWMFRVLQKNKNEQDNVGNLKILEEFHKTF